MTKSESQSIGQQRASNAWNVVQKAKGLDEKQRKEFGTQAKKLSVRILTSGLGPSIAFLEAKKYAPTLLTAINEWIASRPWAMHSVQSSKPDARLSQRIIENDTEFLRMATDECLGYLQWIVRFAEAEDLTDNTVN